MRQVAAGGKRQAENSVARLQQRQKRRLVGLRPGMRLDIGEAAPEQLLGALDREAFGHIDKGAAAVIAAAGIAFGVFVRQQ